MNEQAYLNLLQEVLDNGVYRPDRTGTGTLSCFGKMLVYDVSSSIPLFTTKQVSWKTVIKELLWFVSGSTDVSVLQKQGVKIWDGNSSKQFLTSRNLTYEEGDIGPSYGYQWKHWGADYIDCKTDYTGQGRDQLTDLIKGLQEDPYSRRHIVSAWNVSDLDKMALPPCHMMYQLYVSDDEGWRWDGKNGKCIDMMVTMRSNDLFLGHPYNAVSYAVLMYMIGHLTNMKPRKLIFQLGDAHIYKTHVEQVKEQLSRKILSEPVLQIKRQVKTIDDFKLEDFEVLNYQHHPAIIAPMAV